MTTETFLVDRDGWIRLSGIDKKFFVRAVFINKPRDVTDTDGHRVREIVAEGGVKVKPKRHPLHFDLHQR